MGWRPPYVGGDKEYVSSNAPKRIKEIQFQPMKPQQIVRISEFQAVKHEMYSFTPEGQKVPAPYGVLDTRLGTSSKTGVCSTCHLPLTDCVGHYAYIELPLPVYHIGYFRNCIKILQNICKVRLTSAFLCRVSLL